MLKKTLTAFTLSFLSLLGSGWENCAAQPSQKTSDAATGTLQKMIVESGSVTLDLDLNGLSGSSSLVARPVTLHFAAAANSFLPILVFNDLLRAAETGSMTLIPQNTADAEVYDPGYSTLPAALRASFGQLAIEKMDWDAPVDLVVRDSKNGFVFFNVEGTLYAYDAGAQLLTITEGRLLLSPEFANALGRPSAAGTAVGKISIGAAMQPIEIRQLVNGETKSVEMPPLQGASGGDSNTERFEQVGQSLVKHAFLALENNICNLGCNTSGCTTGSHLCPGCSDPYSASLNSGPNLGSRAWINPFTGFFPRGDSPTPPNDHSGHVHDGVSHRLLVEVNDLNTTLNQGATYFVEAAYVTPHEYAWCQTHPGQCNMYNNASYRQYSVSGITNFTFSPVGSTVRTQPAIMTWTSTGATVNQVEPDPGNDGIWFMGYKVTNPSPGVWHYEYALYNENLDRAIQSFSVPLGAGVNISNIGFHAPPQHPGWAHDGTL